MIYQPDPTAHYRTCRTSPDHPGARCPQCGYGLLARCLRPYARILDDAASRCHRPEGHDGFCRSDDYEDMHRYAFGY